MSFVMPEVVMQRVIQYGITQLRNDAAAFNDIFETYKQDLMVDTYGDSYIAKIRQWFNDTKIPVIQEFSYNPNRVPCISLRLNVENEDEGKAAIGDHFTEGSEAPIHIGVFNVNLDIVIRCRKDSDEAIWLYYIVSYILFRHKMLANTMGVALHTFSASESNKNSSLSPENIWERWIRFRCTVTNMVDMAPYGDPLEEVRPVLAVSSTDDSKEDVDIG